MNQFILLPSGLRINTSHIQCYLEPQNMPGKLVISMPDGDPHTITEDMTAAELDALLSPPSSPIIESVVNLDKLKPGAGCQFTYEGQVKHGVINEITYSHSKKEIFTIISSGDSEFIRWISGGTEEIKD